MGDVFPELKQHERHIRDIIAAEEASFGKTLNKVNHDGSRMRIFLTHLVHGP